MLPTPALPGQVRRSTALAVLSARWCEPPCVRCVVVTGDPVHHGRLPVVSATLDGCRRTT
ncbi:hypothetical protein Rrhod_4340 [Rhodococcus rhodnii LMG 5362]|uniref:Uncharacterized protein n=1 Tax=Rhodococcus rhodnii LMG 5362 TaxID=1273125 RepID=R7WH62_9NOCA|nr:hypothetical protein Rrhod_4340 [Rhodococcus rhodnii LMG 5362]